MSPRAASMDSGKSASQPWDTAAGTLLIQEAGGRVGTLTGDEYTQGPNIVAGSPKVYAALLAALAPHLTKRPRRADANGASPSRFERL